MNDRHRTIERYKRKHRGKEENPYFFLNDLGKRLVPAIKRINNAIQNTVEAVFDALKKFTDDLKQIPWEEYEKKMAEIRPELTPEQIAILEKIRGDGPDDRPNSETKSMGE